MANLLKRMHLAGLCLCAAFSLEAQVAVTHDGRPMARIVLASSEETNQEAAELLQDFVGRISGAALPIIETKKLKANDIVIGEPTNVYYDYNMVGVWQKDDPRWKTVNGKEGYFNEEGKEVMNKDILFDSSFNPSMYNIIVIVSHWHSVGSIKFHYRGRCFYLLAQGMILTDWNEDPSPYWNELSRSRWIYRDWGGTLLEEKELKEKLDMLVEKGN